MNVKSLIIASIALSTLTLGSCSRQQGWTIDGTISGAAGEKVALQAFNNNNWYTIDSIVVSKNDHFEYKAAAPAAYPEVLRLSLNGASIYFPVDSVSKVTLTANAASFNKNYSLKGSQAALKFVEIDSLISSTVAAKGEAAAATDSLLKRQLSQIVLTANEPIASYYVINKRIGNQALFDPASKRDLAVIGAVAQEFDSKLPEDPRTVTLRNIYLGAKAAANPDRFETTIELPEAGLSADIKGYDNKGVAHSLYEAASKGDVVLLSFTNYEHEASPAYNVILADLYNKYHERGFEIFQLAFDEDEVEWKQSAVNLPWITIWNSPSDGSAAIINYNVNMLPLSYIIDRDGVLRTRVTDPTTLDGIISKAL